MVKLVEQPPGRSLGQPLNLQKYLPVTWTDGWQEKLVHVHAVTTLRNCDTYSCIDEYDTFNLAAHVDDDLTSVLKNREILSEELCLPSEPVWLDQVHSNKVIRADKASAVQNILEQADASFTQIKGVVCTVLTADCLPVFFCNQAGTEVAVAHAGWRGLHAGIITNTLEAMNSPNEEILVSLGPAIGPRAFEVGNDVFQAFVDINQRNESAFVATSKNHYLCDIYQLARNELEALGIVRITGGSYCTFQESQKFYSFRRQQKTGRMASLIWIG